MKCVIFLLSAKIISFCVYIPITLNGQCLSSIIFKQYNVLYTTADFVYDCYTI